MVREVATSALARERGDARQAADPSRSAQPTSRTGAEICVDSVSHAFDIKGDVDTRVLANVAFTVPSGQFIALVGPSGCGKTTVLNFMAGLLSPLTGRVLIDGDEIQHPTRHTAYMFARDALFPWRTAQNNVELGLEIQGVDRKERRARAKAVLEMVGLADSATKYPAQLSQGMRQRVAVARTLAMDPDTLLLDEPFAALDAQTRIHVQAEFVKIWEPSHKTVVLVTHDLSEAVLLADRVLVFSSRPGRIVDDIDIDLERPRDIEEIRFSERYLELNERVWQSLKKAQA